MIYILLILFNTLCQDNAYGFYINDITFDIDADEILDIKFDDDPPSKSNVFDSYYNLTDLEPYPEVCDQYSDEKCGELWLKEINQISIRNRNRFGNVFFKYVTDINRKNLELKKKLQLELSKIVLKFKIKVQKFKWKSYKSAETRRIFKKITSTIRSKNETISRELIKIGNKISSIYNKGTPCFKKCLAPGETGIENLFRSEKDYDTLAGFWTAWSNVTGAKIRKLFIDRMNLENKGSRENGHGDVASFILEHDFEEEHFENKVIKLYNKILPLYKEVHAYVRHCLAKFYPGRFDKTGPIPAHLFGNVWGQQWANIYSLIKQCGRKSNLNDFRKEANQKLSSYSIKKLFKISEQFYESIGMPKMTDEFWERSMLKQPRGKIANCHGSAHDLANGQDFRIKMCTQKNINDFTTIHHEMGHIQYYMAYRHLNLVFRGSANSGFHEAIGDTIALSVKTPEHLHKIGLISRIPESDDFDIDYLMATALEKVVFLPFALTMDSFTWSVYNGSVPISELNKHWWDLRYKYQGLKPPVERSENDFDPGAKYHIAFGVPYIRYFVSFLLQFQFYESMCNISGHKGPLHRCDFYESKAAGSKLLEMLKQGKSKHWKETIKILTGQHDIRSESLLKFFDPLYKWLKKENKKLNIHVGW